ncbi:MAG: hypothetical protein ACFNZP_00155 [Bifidobacterium dentium]
MSHGNTTAASAVKSLRIKALLDEVPKNKIARELGVSRPTVAKRLKGDDMKLSEFIQTARILGADPSPGIGRRDPRRKTKKPADASCGQGKQLKEGSDDRFNFNAFQLQRRTGKSPYDGKRRTMVHCQGRVRHPRNQQSIRCPQKT